MVLHQHEAAEFGAKMAFDSLRQRCQDRPSIRRDPALPLVTGRAYRDHQILHQKRLMALEARSRRDHGLDHLVFNVDPRRHPAAAPPLLHFGGARRISALVHATGFDIGTALQAFQTCDLFALPADCLFQGGNFTQKFNQQSLKLWTAQTGKRGWRRHIRVENRPPRADASEKSGVPTLLPLLPWRVTGAKVWAPPPVRRAGFAI